jgi:hypothetical protein
MLAHLQQYKHIDHIFMGYYKCYRIYNNTNICISLRVTSYHISNHTNLIYLLAIINNSTNHLKNSYLNHLAMITNISVSRGWDSIIAAKPIELDFVVEGRGKIGVLKPYQQMQKIIGSQEIRWAH